MKRWRGFRDSLIVLLAAAVTIVSMLAVYGNAPTRPSCRFSRIGGNANECHCTHRIQQ